MRKEIEKYLNNELELLDTQKKKLFETLSQGKINKALAIEFKDQIYEYGLEEKFNPSQLDAIRAALT